MHGGFDDDLAAGVASDSTRFGWVRRLVKAQPSLVLVDGQLLRDTLARERLTESEVLQAIRLRGAGAGAVEDVGAVVLEIDGTLSVIPRAAMGAGSALADVAAFSRGWWRRCAPRAPDRSTS